MVLRKTPTFLAVILGFFLTQYGQPVLAQFPFEYDTRTESSILGTTAGLFGLGVWVAQSTGTVPILQVAENGTLKALDPSAINAFDRSATRNWSPEAAGISDILMYSSAVMPLALSFSGVGSKQPLTVTAMHMETLLLNGGVTFLMKNIFQRPRPFMSNSDPRIPDHLRLSRTARRSFPSGHTSTSFASMVFLATVFSELYPDSDAKAYVWGGCLAVAGTTGYLRYKAGYHYPTDILAGAALGAFVGWLVPRQHEIETQGLSGSKRKTPPMTIGFSIAF